MLHDISRILANAKLDLALAIVSTKVDQVADTFYVRASDGEKLQPADVDPLVSELSEVLRSES